MKIKSETSTELKTHFQLHETTTNKLRLNGFSPDFHFETIRYCFRHTYTEASEVLSRIAIVCLLGI